MCRTASLWKREQRIEITRQLLKTNQADPQTGEKKQKKQRDEECNFTSLEDFKENDYFF